MTDVTYQLVIRRGPQVGRLYTLEAETHRLGRSPLADIVIDDVEVSRQHAIITRGAAGYQIQDAGSTNGTFIDGRRLGGEPHLLVAGQVVSIGSNVELVYEVVAPGASVAALIAADEEGDAPPEPPPTAEPPATPDRVVDFSPRAGGAAPPPPPPPVVSAYDDEQARADRNRTIIITVLITLALVACCCLTLAALGLYFLGVVPGSTTTSSGAWLPVVMASFA